MNFPPSCRFPGLILLACCWLTLAVPSSAADIPIRKVTVVGSVTIKVAPDEMHWTVQVTVADATLAKAKARHDASLAGVLKFLKSFPNGIKDLQTGGIRFDKNMYPGDNAEARKNPFSCSTQFTFTLTDFDKYGPICDSLAKLDGVEIQSVNYASSKEEATKREALKQALLNAHDKASDLAVAAACYIDKPLDIQEGAPDNGPRPVMRMMANAPGGTPGAVPGQIEISAQVTATYDMYYR